MNLSFAPFSSFIIPKVQYSSYSAFEKLKILQYIKLYGLRVAAHYFTIDHSMISHWKRKKEKLKSVRGNN